MHVSRSIVLTTLVACATPVPSSDDDWSDGGVDRIDAPRAVDAISGDPDAPSSAPDAGTADDPAAAGTWDVHEVDDTIAGAAATVFSPSDDGGATAAAGPFPLVVVSTGFQIGRDNYAATCRHLASWGYVVVSYDYGSGNHQEKAAAVSELLDGVIAEIGSRIDGARIALAGHSLGGKVSINAAILDARVGAVVGWDPVDALPPFSDGSTSVTPELMDDLRVPLLVIGETTDAGSGGGMACAPAADNYTRFFAAACEAPRALEVTIPGADHTDWVDDRSSCGFACLFCATGTTADATIHAITRRATTAWLEVHLRGREELAPFLDSPGTPATVRNVVPGC
jgi:dienelactone hydrolase